MIPIIAIGKEAYLPLNSVKVTPSKIMTDESINDLFLPNPSVKVMKADILAIRDAKTTVEKRVSVDAYSQRKSTSRSSASEWNDAC